MYPIFQVDHRHLQVLNQGLSEILRTINFFWQHQCLHAEEEERTLVGLQVDMFHAASAAMIVNHVLQKNVIALYRDILENNSYNNKLQYYAPVNQPGMKNVKEEPEQDLMRCHPVDVTLTVALRVINVTVPSKDNSLLLNLSTG